MLSNCVSMLCIIIGNKKDDKKRNTVKNLLKAIERDVYSAEK